MTRSKRTHPEITLPFILMIRPPSGHSFWARKLMPKKVNKHCAFSFSLSWNDNAWSDVHPSAENCLNDSGDPASTLHARTTPSGLDWGPSTEGIFLSLIFFLLNILRKIKVDSGGFSSIWGGFIFGIAYKVGSRKILGTEIRVHLLRQFGPQQYL